MQKSFSELEKTAARIRAELKKVEAEANPRPEAEDLDTEAVRLSTARAKRDVLQMRLADAENAARQTRMHDLHTRIAELTTEHAAADHDANEADAEARKLALELFQPEFRPRIDAALIQSPSVEGNKHRAKANKITAKLEELKTELRQAEGR